MELDQSENCDDPEVSHHWDNDAVLAGKWSITVAAVWATKILPLYVLVRNSCSPHQGHHPSEEAKRI